jgi:hypothetical protein
MKPIFYFLVLMLIALPARSWTEFPHDPIYAPYPVSSLPDDYFPSVIFSNKKFDRNGDRVRYKMWHQGDTGIALSYSNDGIHWSLQGIVIFDVYAYHPTVIYDKNGFGGGPYHYKMWYWTGDISFFPPHLAIKFSQSMDGVTWTTPVATTQGATSFLADITQEGSPFYQFYGFGTVLYNASATSMAGEPYTFPYVAFFDSSAAHQGEQTTQEAVGLAYSTDGISWTRFGSQPVLIPSGSTSDWDGLYAYRASVIKLKGIYHMFYSGSNDEINDFGYAHGIGHATSSDGINWTKDSCNPIFSTDDPGEAWRSGRTLAPSAVVFANRFGMWFSGGTNSGSDFASAEIGYALSRTKSAACP